jgi:hypothetical protein
LAINWIPHKIKLIHQHFFHERFSISPNAASAELPCTYPFFFEVPESTVADKLI